MCTPKGYRGFKSLSLRQIPLAATPYNFGFVAQGGFAALGALVGGLGVFILTLPIPVQTALGRIWPAAAGALSGGLWGCWNWQIFLKYTYGVSTGIRDPILQRDTGFYLFTLPFYDNVYWGLLWTTVIALAAAVYFALDARILEVLSSEPSPFANSSAYGGRNTPHRFFLFPLATMAGVVAWGQYLNIYHLLYSKWGVVTGAGWTDVHVRLPAHLIAPQLLCFWVFRPSFRRFTPDSRGNFAGGDTSLKMWR